MRPVTVALPQPCAESWEAMTPADAGRHCAACQQVVVDFTRKTDAEVLAYLAGARAAACGRFRPDQLGRPLRPAAPVSRWRAWLAAALALGGVLEAGRAAGQARSNYAGPLPEADKPATGTTAPAAAGAPQSPPAGATVAAPAPAGTVTVRGVVLAERDGLGLPGVTVLLKGSSTIGTSTDAAGEFALVVPAADSVRLVFSYIGFARQEHTMGAHAAPLTVRLAEDSQQLMGELIIVGAYETRRPWPWHPRALYGWARYRVGRLLGRR